MTSHLPAHHQGNNEDLENYARLKHQSQTNGDVHHSLKYNSISQQHSGRSKSGRSKDETFEAGPPAIQVNGVALHKPNGDLKQANGVVKHLNEPNGDVIHVLQSESKARISEESEKEGKGKSPVSNLGTPKGKSGRPNGSVTFAEDVKGEPERRESPSPGTSRGTFRNAVRRHFGRDRLFYLVQTLLSSVEEEKVAHLDLIESFETARQIKVPVSDHTSVPQPPPSATRQKHRRRRSEIPLADKIKLDRLASRNNSLTETSDPGCNGDSSSVSETKDVRKHSVEDVREVTNDICDTSVEDETKCFNEGSGKPTDCDKESDEDVRQNRAKSISGKGKSSKGSKVKFKNSDEGEECQEQRDSKEITDQICDKQESLNSAENLDEKADSYLDEISDVTKELDKLVLDSVLINSFSESGEGESKCSGETVIDPVIVIEVESNSNSEFDDDSDIDDSKETEVYYIPNHQDPFSNYKGECVIELVGATRAMADSDAEEFYSHVEVEDLGDDESDSDLKYLNEKVACISTVEYESKRKTKLKPSLGPIAEAENSAGSFRSFHNSRNDSPEITVVRCASSQNTSEDCDKYDNGIAVYRNKPKPVKERIRYEQQVDDTVITRRDENVVYVRKTHTKRQNKKANKQNPKPSKIISIDLMDVYNENKDLQKVDRREGLSRTRKRTKISSPRTKSPRAKITKHVRHKKSSDAVPLPPRIIGTSRPVRAMSCTSTRSAPDLDRRTEIIEFYRSYQSRKDSSRYDKPDFVLWDRIGLSSRCKSAVERYADEMEDFDDNERTGSNTLLRRPQEWPNTCKVWDMPITEAVKRVKSVKNVPSPRDLEDTTPRHVRVQQVYAQLKKTRRGSGYTSCKPLVSLTRRPSDFRV